MIYIPSSSCYELIKTFEGFRKNSYLCPANVWTIGYGTTDNVKQGDTCSEHDAEQYLIRDVKRFADAINENVKVPLTQNQFDSLCCFVYNVGIGAFKKSTLLTKLNAKDYKGASEQFARWNKAGGKELPGLTKRRESERALFVKD